MKADGKKITSKKILAINERRVKALMAERGLTQTHLAKQVGMSVANLNRLLKNHRSAHRHANRIAEALGVSPRRILLSPSVFPAIGSHELADSQQAA